MSRKKVALILHGFPGLPEKYPIRDYLNLRGFNGIYPNLFDRSFDLSEETVMEIIETALYKRVPDLIIAFSMGGLVAPQVAKKYPDAKLVFVASGSKVNPKYKIHDFVINDLNLNLLEIILRLGEHVPFSVYKFFFQLFNPHKGDSNDRLKYNENIRSTFSMYKKHSVKKKKEIVKFVRSIDNYHVLASLRNKTIIFSGGRDIVMPYEESVELNRLIKNSFIVNNKGRLHHNVFDERDFTKLDEFLREK